MSFDLSELGVEKNIPKVNFTEYSGLIVAEPKWGKTTLSSLYPNAIILPFEKGYKGNVANIFKRLFSWDDFIEFIDKLEEKREEIGDTIKVLVFDTVNEAYSMVDRYTLQRLSILDGKNYMAAREVPHGQFYSEKDKDFMEQIRRIENLGFMPLFISHLEKKTVTPKKGEPYDIYTSTMPERLQKIINPLVSYIIYGERTLADDGNGNKIPKRVLLTKSDEMVTAGSRVRLDHNIVFDTEEEAMEKFQNAFKDSIRKTLINAGIEKDLDVLSKEQQEEKNKEITKSLSGKKNEIELSQVIKQILSEIGTLTKEGKAPSVIMPILTDNGITDPHSRLESEMWHVKL